MKLKAKFIPSREGGYIGLVETSVGWRTMRVSAIDPVRGRVRLTLRRRAVHLDGAIMIDPGLEFEGRFAGNTAIFENIHLGDRVYRTFKFVGGAEPVVHDLGAIG